MFAGNPLDPASGQLNRRQLLGRLGVIGAAGIAATASGACTAQRSVTGPTRPSGALDVRDFGARGDGRADDTSAVETALSALRPGQTLLFPTGTYRHSRVLRVVTRDVTLQGPGRLYATHEQSSALRIDAPGVSVRAMVIAMGATTRRWSGPDQHKIFVAPHAGIVVTDVHIEGSAAAGLFCFGARDFRFTRVQVSDTRADGIHMTHGSHHGVVDSPRITRSGDDGVAVVSYATDAGPCHHIEVLSPRVRATTGGRGVSVVGGTDISYRDVDVDRSAAAGVYVACEGTDFVTRGVARVVVTGGIVTNANTNRANDQGAVLIFNGRADAAVDHVTISGLTVAGTRASASRQIGAVADGLTARLTDVVFRNLDLADEPRPYQGNAPPGQITLVDVRAAGTAVGPAR